MREILIFSLFLSSSLICSAAEVAPKFSSFNIKCPAEKLGNLIDNYYHECHAGHIYPDHDSCLQFVEIFKELMPTYDCARPSDMLGEHKYVVPALRLFGDGRFSDYHLLIHDLVFTKQYVKPEYSKARDSAAVIFFSSEFRKVVDAEGDLYDEEWWEHDKKQ